MCPLEVDRGCNHLNIACFLFLCVKQPINLFLLDTIPASSAKIHHPCHILYNNVFHLHNIFPALLLRSAFFNILSDVLERERSNSVCSQASMSSLWSTQSMDETATTRQKAVTRQNSYLSAVHSPVPREYNISLITLCASVPPLCSICA